MCKICFCDDENTPEDGAENTTSVLPINVSQRKNDYELKDLPYDYSKVDQNFYVQDVRNN